MLAFPKNSRILVVVAHPDDEVLGIGGTMHRLINEEGCTVRTVILGEGITSRSETRDPERWSKELQIHRQNIEDAASCIGYQSTGIYDLPDNRFDSIALLDIIKVIEQEKRDFQPEIIFTHHGGDLNIDHKRTFEAVITACRPMSHEKVKTIITFETPSGTEWRASTDPKNFIPNFFFSITEAGLDAKKRAMECYEFEKRPYPHPRSSEALTLLAQYRGVQVGVNWAEAFCLVRNIFSKA